MRSFFSRPKTPNEPVSTEVDSSLFRWTAAIYLCIAFTMIVVLGAAIWGVSHDLNEINETFVSSEMNRLRSHAERTVNRIQDELRQFHGLGDDFRRKSFLRQHWESTVRRDDSRLYSALILPSGLVFMHLNPEREGQKLGSVWYDRVVAEAGDDVVDTRVLALTGGERVFDVRVPIILDNEVIGFYHTGLTYAWLKQEMDENQLPILRSWGLILVSIWMAILVAGVSLFQISRRIAVLREAIKLARARRFAEGGQLMAGLVHEIRNPLNAMRLNLHVLSRFLNQRGLELECDTDELAAIDHAQIIRESIQEIERVEGLLRLLLGYARPDQSQAEDLEIRRELESTLNFLKPVLERAEVGARARFADSPVFVHIDRERLRQILINLIMNAKDATGPGGQIQIEVNATREEVEILVADDGPGIPPTERERVFEPFYSTKENGTGLGLALVRRYVEEASGTVSCDKNEPRGALFRLRFGRAVGNLVPTQSNLSSTT